MRKAQRTVEDDYAVLEKLGQGGYGVVYLGQRRSDGLLVAIKRSNLAKSRKDGLDLRKEALFLRLVSEGDDPCAKYFVKYIDSYELEDEFVLVMEYVQHGNLLKFVQKEVMSLEAASFVIYQLVKAVNYMHSKGIMHRDLSPGNILVSPIKDSRNKFFPKICDFGLATEIPESQRVKKYTVCGTPNFQNFRKLANGYGPEMDLCSLGAVLFFMLTQKTISDKHGDMVPVEVIQRRVGDDRARDLIMQLVLSDADYERACERPKTLSSPQSVLLHPFTHGGVRDKSLPRSMCSNRFSSSRLLREVNDQDVELSKRTRDPSETRRAAEAAPARGRSARRRDARLPDSGLCSERRGRDRSQSGAGAETRRLDSLQVRSAADFATRRGATTVRSEPAPHFRSAPGRDRPRPDHAAWPLHGDLAQLTAQEGFAVVFPDPGRCLLRQTEPRIVIEFVQKEAVSRIAHVYDACTAAQRLDLYEPARWDLRKPRKADPLVETGAQLSVARSARDLDRLDDLRAVYNSIGKFVSFARDRVPRCSLAFPRRVGRVMFSGRVELLLIADPGDRSADRKVEFDRTSETLVLKKCKHQFTEDELEDLQELGKSVLNADRRNMRKERQRLDKQRPEEEEPQAKPSSRPSTRSIRHSMEDLRGQDYRARPIRQR